MGLRKKIIVIGGGFAGLELIKRLGNSNNYDIVLVDRNNYNFFPPLIYQVSSGFMEPSPISYPFRKILRNLKNVRFRLGSLEQLVPDENKIILDNDSIHPLAQATSAAGTNVKPCAGVLWVESPLQSLKK